MSDVLDASAALAWLKGEPGAVLVAPLLHGGVISSVNWSEVLQKSMTSGTHPAETTALFQDRGVTVLPATTGDAVIAAQFWEPRSPLSLADRFCLALAYRLNARAVTAERSWAELDVGAEVLVIR